MYKRQAQQTNITYQLSILNCNAVPVYTCPPTNNILQVPENAYLDMAIDTGLNLYFVSGFGSLYKQSHNGQTSCSYLGSFPAASINALVTDVNGDVYAAGAEQFNSSPASSSLFKYDHALGTFSRIGNFPQNYFSSGDLFFYQGRLFLSCTYHNYSRSFLVEVNQTNPIQSCFYMDLGTDEDGYGAFATQDSVGISHVFMLSTTATNFTEFNTCLLYTSDAADE